MIVVRFALPDENVIARTIVEKAFAPVREVYRPKIDAVATVNNESLDSRLILALVEDVPVGSACVYAQEESLRVSQLAVLPSFQKRGVARQLLSFAEQVAHGSGCIDLRLSTIQETGNVAIFERLGFSVQKTSVATWCVSDRFAQLTEVEMSRPVGENEKHRFPASY